MSRLTGPTVETPIVVVGSGVIGLTIALLLARRGYEVGVMARDLPSDVLSQDWSSPWAGANWCPFGSDSRISRWETEGLRRLQDLIPTGLAMRLPITRFASTEAGLHNHWYRGIVSSYRILPAKECPENSFGVSFESVSMNAPYYLQWLEAQARACGVTFTRRTLDSLEEVVKGGIRVVVNASGLGSRTLKDVNDLKVEPIRGQVVLVRAPDIRSCVMDASSTADPTRSTYIIPRPNSGGQVICGGCYEVGSYDKTVNADLSNDILKKCLAHFPQLRTKTDDGIAGIDVIRHCVGFRPSRRGGPRLEKEVRDRFVVIHAYGIGPAGYQASWGMAEEACQLVGEAMTEGFDVPMMSSLAI
ncbi:D-amino-acid oxidase, partial [Tremellales sp. Uapishka_1]